MSFRLVPKSVTLNDLERRNGRYIAYYFTEFSKPVFQQPRRSLGGGFMHESIVFCSACTMSYRTFTFAISSLDEFLANGSLG